MTSNGAASFFSSTVPRTPGNRRLGEPAWQYLERSSEPDAKATRDRWDAWLARMPAGPARHEIISDLKARDDHQVSAALSELVTFILLDSAYPAVELKPAGGTTSQTDFAVALPNRTHFEVHRVTAPSGNRADTQRRKAITEELRKITSPDFWLAVSANVGTILPSMQQVRKQAGRGSPPWTGRRSCSGLMPTIRTGRPARQRTRPLTSPQRPPSGQRTTHGTSRMPRRQGNGPAPGGRCRSMPFHGQLSSGGKAVPAWA